MRVALYNRWLHTLGGGERETAAFAQALQPEHAVDLLTHQPVDLDLFRSRLDLPLPDVRVRALPCDAGLEQIAAASSEYDLFVNMSHGDMFVPRARHNLLRVFFPVRAVPDTASNAAGSTGERARLTLLDGFYRPEEASGRTFAWTSGHARAVLHMPSEQRRFLERRHLHCVLHGWRPAGARPAEVRLAVNGRALGTHRLAPDGAWTTWRVPLPRELAVAERLEVTLETMTFQPRDAGLDDDCRELGVALAEIGVGQGGPIGLRARVRARGVPDEAGYAAMLHGRTLPAARSYDLLLANSRYTQEWISRRWGLPSDVLYPPVDLDLPAGPKRPTILSVGRFFAGSHNKKHLPMIETFKALCDAGLRGWEYHLAGGCDEVMPEHRAYLDGLRAATEGYPITFHVNASFDTLRALYATSRIYWHATGFGEDEERDPEAFEHFGITTVEAMAAGCVPVVIGKGGQVEIVEPGSGFLWTTLAELQSHTRTLIEDTAQWERMSHAAQERSRGFGMDRFTREVRALVDRYTGQS